MSNPMYRQIAEDLRAQIESGKLRPGQQLRTELELREHYGASRNTVRDAIKWLITLGLVETRAPNPTEVDFFSCLRRPGPDLRDFRLAAGQLLP
jgi:DNA-binding FadR family transcriptional regulator